ncbi:DEAD-domain-containing protein [Pleurotus eryngii]|uniref:RNA helicase n=1 Tax=Pleurotus eryngii TaxID=5323 RepID=A0A9P5ZNV4_PLEER|nr:DEAD-domain-containing protein [Pleurotus eryngii]
MTKPSLPVISRTPKPRNDGSMMGRKSKKRQDASETSANDPEPSSTSTLTTDAMEVDASGTKTSKTDKRSKKKKAKSAPDELPTEPTIEETIPSGTADNVEGKLKKSKKRKNAVETSQNDAPSPTTPPSSSLSESEAAAYLQTHEITIHSAESRITPIIEFSNLPIPKKLLAAFSGTFKEPTPIQACTWPAAFMGKDVVGIAETGSGKTLAFGIPLLSRLLASPPSSSGVAALIVAPTRELAVQTHDTLSALGEQFGIGSVAVYGGVSKEAQINLLKAKQGEKSKTTTRIVVGTPGRILDLSQDGTCDLSGVDYLVLDEADRMLDRGFENDIRRIISFTKQGSSRQTMMFSATWPEAVRRLASTFQQDPVRVTVGSDDLTANTRVEQTVEVFDDPRSKDTRLLNHLRTIKSKTAGIKPRILIFALYKKEASRVEQSLHQKGFSVGALHGDMSQNLRLEALENFKNGTTQLLVATDVAARGLDIPNVAAVINYTFPLTIEDYIHRIGRTGRGGKSGKSITFFTGEGHEKALAGELARVLRDAGFEKECEDLREKFPMTIKKKTHSVYGAFYRDDIPAPKGPTKIVFT